MFKYALKEKVGKTLQKPLDATRSYEYRAQMYSNVFSFTFSFMLN